MNKPVRHLVVVGGGAAGWITAGRVAADHPPETGIRVTLIESPDVNPIGVGEGTWPTMRATLAALGISETDFVRDCDASFKQGTRFDGWRTGGDDDRYYHPFTLPAGYPSTNLAAYWIQRQSRESFAEAVGSQSQLCDNGLAPKQQTTPEYAAVANYGYHLDAGRFATQLQQHCTRKLGVNHVLDHVIGIDSDDAGFIESLRCKNSGSLAGDLFVDCTGFASRIIGEHFGIPFVDRKAQLFIDSALAAQVPYADQDAAVQSQTIAAARDSGWIWDIGLASRRGVGHVYSSAHTNDASAEQTLRAYIGEGSADDTANIALRKITINPGHRQKFWHRNCVAVGMAAGFLEPLEASALVMVELSAKMISEELPASRETVAIVGKRFNARFLYRWDRIVDFLKLHYVLSERNDSAFWRDNRAPDSISEILREYLELWRHRTPWAGDFTQVDEVFSAASYQYVLYGMGFETTVRKLRGPDRQRAEQCISEVAERSRKWLAGLPTNRALLNSIRDAGLPCGKVA